MGGEGAAADGGCWALQLKGPLKPAVGLLQLWVTALLLLGRIPESQAGDRGPEGPACPTSMLNLSASLTMHGGCVLWTVCMFLYTWPLAQTAAFFDSGDLN